MDWLLVFFALCFLCMAVMVPMMWFGRGRWSHGFHSHDWWHAGDAEDARAILDRRYASGELTPERYQAMRAELGTGEANKA